MPRFLKWIGVVLGVLVLLVVGAALALETKWFRDFATARASAALGREITVEDIDFRWVPPWRPTIRVEGLRVANAEWAGTEPMADIAAATVRVSLPGLLSGRPSFPEVVLERPKLRLARNEEGVGNWDLGGRNEPEAGDGKPNIPDIGRIEIREGEVAYADRPLDLEVATKVDTVTGPDGEPRIRVQGGGSLKGQEVAVDATVGSLLALARPEDPFPVDGELRVGSVRTRLAGTITDPVQLAGMDLRVELEGQDLSDLVPITGFPSAKTPPLKVSGQLAREGSAWAIKGLAGTIGDSDIGGDVMVDLGREKPLIEADLVSKRLDIDDFAGFVGGTPGTGEGETASAKNRQDKARERSDGRLIPDDPINLAALNAADARIRFRGERVQTPGFPVRDLDAQVALEGGRLRVDPVKVAVAGGTVAGRLALDASGGTPRAEVALDLSRIQLAQLFQGTAFAKEMGGAFGGRIDLRGEGATPRALAARLDGKASVVMGGGKVSGLVVEALGIDAAEALGFLISKDKPVPVRCAVVDFGVTQGYAASRTLVFDTEDTNVAGEAKINFGRETFDVELLAHPKDPSPLAARTGVGVEGTFLEPRVTVQAGGLLARGAAAIGLGVLLGPVAALVPLIELGLGEDSPCGELIRDAQRPAR